MNDWKQLNHRAQPQLYTPTTMEDLNDEEKWRLSVLPFTADKATITNPIQVAIGLWGSVWQEKTLEKWLIFLRFWDHKTRPPNNALM